MKPGLPDQNAHHRRSAVPPASRSLAQRFPRQTFGVNGLLLSSTVLFFIGLLAPLLTFKRFFIFSDTVSLASALWQLLMEGHILLFMLIGVFSVLFPLAKLGLLAGLWNAGEKDDARYQKHLHWLGLYGKWSMLDVFVVAVIIVVAKMGGVASVEVHVGLYAFAASVFLTGIVTARVAAIARQLPAPD